MEQAGYIPGPWVAKFYPDEKEEWGTWGVRQGSDAASVEIERKVLCCGFSVCNIVPQDVEDIKNGIEATTARLIAAAPDLFVLCQQALFHISETGGNDCLELRLESVINRVIKQVDV